jgi:hypothetical protein
VGKEIANADELRRYLRRLGYANEGQEGHLPTLEQALAGTVRMAYEHLLF